MTKTDEEAWKFLEQYSRSSASNNFPRANLRGLSAVTNTNGMNELRKEFKGEIGELSKKLDQVLSGLAGRQSGVFEVQDSCITCGDRSHTCDRCPLTTPESVNQAQGFRGNQDDPFSNTYNPGWKRHPNFSWKNQENQGQSSQSNQSSLSRYQNSHGNYQQNQNNSNVSGNNNNRYQSNNNQDQSPLEKKMQEMMGMMKEYMQHTNSNTQSIAALGKQVGQLADQLSK